MALTFFNAFVDGNPIEVRFLSSLAHLKCPAILSLMHSMKYIILQDGTGWRGYLEGYPEHETYGESFEDLQIKLWQLHQELIAQESERNQYRHHSTEHGQYGNEEHDRHHNPTSTLSRHTPTTSRPMSRAQIKRRARVEQLLFAMISNR